MKFAHHHVRQQLMLTACLLAIGLTGIVRTCSGDDKPAGRVFRAGAATSNITPPLGQLIVGGWSPTPASYIHDELHARALVLDDGNTQLAFVISDNVGIPREVFDAARRMIEDETDLEGSHVLMAATHTHSATTARGDTKVIPVEEFSNYQSFLARRIADSVRIAIGNLQPAVIGWGKVDVPEEVFNRRWFTSDEQLHRNPFGGIDKVRMNPPAGSPALLRPAGPVDPEVCFVSLKSIDGQPIALLANYSLHYVGGVPNGHVSADYFALFANRIAELLAADSPDSRFVGIMTNGTSGNINNINFKDRGPRMEPYQKMRAVADRVASAVYEAHQGITFQDWVPLGAHMMDLPLATRKPTPEMLAYFDEVLTKPEDAEPWHSRERIYADRVRRLVDAPDTVDVPLQAFRIGGLGIAAIPFETFVETGLELKEQSPLEMTFTIELANGSYGYLPTPEHHELGGYETWLGTSHVEEQASTHIARALLKQFDGLNARTK